MLRLTLSNINVRMTSTFMDVDRFSMTLHNHLKQSFIGSYNDIVILTNKAALIYILILILVYSCHLQGGLIVPKVFLVRLIHSLFTAYLLADPNRRTHPW